MFRRCPRIRWRTPRATRDDHDKSDYQNPDAHRRSTYPGALDAGGLGSVPARNAAALHRLLCRGGLRPCA